MASGTIKRHRIASIRKASSSRSAQPRPIYETLVARNSRGKPFIPSATDLRLLIPTNVELTYGADVIETTDRHGVRRALHESDVLLGFFVNRAQRFDEAVEGFLVFGFSRLDQHAFR